MEGGPTVRHLGLVMDTRCDETLEILAADPCERRPLAQEHARLGPLVFAQKPWLPRVEAAEVKESERTPVDEVSAIVARELAGVKIPVRDVVAGVLQDVVVEERRHEVDPPLVGEHHLRDVDERLAPRALPPPVEERARARADPDEAEIVDTGGKHEEAVDLPFVLRIGAHRVRREHDAVFAPRASRSSASEPKILMSGSR